MQHAVGCSPTVGSAEAVESGLLGSHMFAQTVGAVVSILIEEFLETQCWFCKKKCVYLIFFVPPNSSKHVKNAGLTNHSGHFSGWTSVFHFVRHLEP